jgi:hypothetical protein
MQYWTYQNPDTEIQNQQRFGFVQKAASEFWLVAKTLLESGKTSINSLLGDAISEPSRSTEEAQRSAYHSLEYIEEGEVDNEDTVIPHQL